MAENTIIKEINYTNDRGYHKKIVVYAPTNEGLYKFHIWSRDTGDLCSCGEDTKENLNEFFRHYGITDTIDG